MKDTIIDLTMPLYAEIYDFDEYTHEDGVESIVERVGNISLNGEKIWYNGLPSHNFKLLEQDMNIKPFSRRWESVDGKKG